MQSKQILKGENGEELVYINLSLPAFGRGILKKTADPFYKAVAEKFCVFVKRRLLPLANQAKNENSFKPFSAVMKYDVEETDERLTVILRSFVFDGNERVNGKTVKQVWDKKTGLLIYKK